MKKQDKKQQRPLHEIAYEIRRVWGKSIPQYALPYLNAMQCLTNITDNFGCDSADSIVRYFLSNASTWRGEDAKRIKSELRKILKN